VELRRQRKRAEEPGLPWRELAHGIKQIPAALFIIGV